MKPRYPINIYLGKYESFVLKLYGSDRFWFVDQKLSRFFDYFPANEGLEKFTIADICDYRIWRRREDISESTLEIELREVRNFWNYLIEDLKLPLFNPVKKPGPAPQRKNNSRLSIEDFRRLLLHSSCQLRERLLAIVMDEECENGLHGRSFQLELWTAANAAGLPWMKSVSIFRQCIHGLWRQIIKREYPKLCDAFLQEPQPLSDAPANVETAPTYKGSLIIDEGDLMELIGGVH